MLTREEARAGSRSCSLVHVHQVIAESLLRQLPCCDHHSSQWFQCNDKPAPVLNTRRGSMPRGTKGANSASPCSSASVVYQDRHDVCCTAFASVRGRRRSSHVEPCSLVSRLLLSTSSAVRSHSRMRDRGVSLPIPHAAAPARLPPPHRVQERRVRRHCGLGSEARAGWGHDDADRAQWQQRQSAVGNIVRC